ncbi:MAG TPA: c-type cytochrome [Stenomitos sp.]
MSDVLGFPLAPEQASGIAPQVDLLFWCLTGLSAAMTVGIACAIVIFVVKYHHTSKADRRRRSTGNWLIEFGWILIPLGLFLGFFLWGSRLYVHEASPPRGATEIFVVGKQWMWKIEHPSGRREINELHVPVGKPVVLSMISQDVIHDVYVPAFRIHHDVLPGRYMREWFTVTRPGRYHLFCSQYCGTQHAGMVGWVVAMPPAEFEAWLGTGNAQPSMLQAGATSFRELGCTGCHMGASSVRAPRLEGLYGRPVPLQGGGFAIADDQYLHDSILLPKKQIVAGYQPVMPSYQGQIDESQVLELVAYLRSLGSERSMP